MNPAIIKSLLMGAGFAGLVMYLMWGRMELQDKEMEEKSIQNSINSKEFKAQMALETAQFYGVVSKEELGKKSLEQHEKLKTEVEQEKAEQAEKKRLYEEQLKIQQDLKKEVDSQLKEFSDEDLKKL